MTTLADDIVTHADNTNRRHVKCSIAAVANRVIMPPTHFLMCWQPTAKTTANRLQVLVTTRSVAPPRRSKRMSEAACVAVSPASVTETQATNHTYLLTLIKRRRERG